jgi:hypothetical protein
VLPAGTGLPPQPFEYESRRDWRGILKGTRLRRLARAGAQTDVDWRPRHPGRISKQGNRFLRVLFVQAARVVLMKPQTWERHWLKSWIESAQKRMHHNVLAIALANKLACIAWAVLNKERNFESRTRPGQLSCRAVLTPGKAWPGNAGATVPQALLQQGRGAAHELQGRTDARVGSTVPQNM